MDISTVIVSYNTKELIIECLDSVQKAASGLKSEIIVVDNASQDGTQDEIRKKFPNVSLIENNKNLGFSKANNIALVKAKGKYILILNPDTKLFPETIKKLIDFFGSKGKDTGLVTCRLELASGVLDKDCRRHFPTPWVAFTHFSNLSKIFPKTRFFDSYYYGYVNENTEHEIDACAGAFMFTTRDALKKVGLFDEDFFFYGEDIDLCFRYKQKGYKIIYTPVTKAIHYKGVASGIKEHTKHLSKATKESKKRALSESTRAMKLFYEKHYKNKYPAIINFFVIFGIILLDKIRQLK